MGLVHESMTAAGVSAVALGRMEMGSDIANDTEDSILREGGRGGV